jgi:glycosyltransferase involved in cell wall biosynthesis
MKARLAIFVTHPVQYHVPIWRGLACTPGLEVEVFYFSDHSVRGGLDTGFGRNVSWDVPMLEGYSHTFVSRDADLSRPDEVTLVEPEILLGDGGFTHVLIHGYTHGFEKQVLEAASKLGLRSIVRGEFADAGRNRNILKRTARDIYLRRFYARTDALCYVGTEARRHLSRFVSDESRLFFSPYSVDTELFERQKAMFEPGSSRRASGVAEDSFVFLFSGKLIPRKEPLLLIEALGRLPREMNVELLVVGDGPLKDAVVDRGNAVLGSRFHFRGFVNQRNLGGCFRASNALVLPSNYEAWGLVANEAMQFGLPVVLSDRVNSHEDLVVPSRTGYVFRSGDVNSLAEALSLLCSDPAKAATMGAKAAEHVQRFSTTAAVRGLVDAVHGVSPENVHA